MRRVAAVWRTRRKAALFLPSCENLGTISQQNTKKAIQDVCGGEKNTVVVAFLSAGGAKQSECEGLKDTTGGEDPYVEAVPAFPAAQRFLLEVCVSEPKQRGGRGSRKGAEVCLQLCF